MQGRVTTVGRGIDVVNRNGVIWFRPGGRIVRRAAALPEALRSARPAPTDLDRMDPMRTMPRDQNLEGIFREESERYTRPAQIFRPRDLRPVSRDLKFDLLIGREARRD